MVTSKSVGPLRHVWTNRTDLLVNLVSYMTCMSSFELFKYSVELCYNVGSIELNRIVDDLGNGCDGHNDNGNGNDGGDDDSDGDSMQWGWCWR